MTKRAGKAIAYLWLFFAAVLLYGCEEKKEGAAQFTDEVQLPITEVKNQGHSQYCWVYAMLATIETEHIVRGDSVSLSADYVIRQYLTEQTRRYYLSNFREPIADRGVAPMLLRLIQRFGAEPTHSFQPREQVDYSVLSRRLMQRTRLQPSLGEAMRQADDLLDEATGFLPLHVFMLSAEYTPLEFAHSVCRRDEYTTLTSFTHHPFGQSFAIEVPDNLYADTCHNVPIDTLMQRIDRSLRAGHPVCWEGDISEKGFSFKKGVADVAASVSKGATQAQRQREFETRRTTDDHCMMLMGIARDRQGRRYYIAKNSWGKGNPYGGLMYLSEDYVRLKTIMIVLPSAT